MIRSILDDADHLVARNAAEAHVAGENLEIGRADAGVENAHDGGFGHEQGIRDVADESDVSSVPDQSAQASLRPRRSSTGGLIASGARTPRPRPARRAARASQRG